jgi:hypothetical protein
MAQEVGDLTEKARTQVVAQALGVAAGVLLREDVDTRKIGIMSPLDTADPRTRHAPGFERRALAERMALHHHERLRLQILPNEYGV